METVGNLRRERPVLGGILLAAGLLVVLVLWFGRACWGGWWIADRSQMADTYLLSTVFERWAVQVSGGALPLWFPEFAGGFPLHAAWMYGLLYPPLAVFLVLPPEAAWTWLAVVHIVFGALGMYVFLWDGRRDVVAAASGAVVFAFSGFLLGRVTAGHLNLVMPFAWTPWVLRAAVRAVRGEPGAAGWLGICAGVGLLAGHVQIWFYAAPLVAAYALVEARRRHALRAAVPRLVLGAALALGIAAIQWIPAWELFSVSGHPPEKPDVVAECSASASALAAQVAPRFASSSSERPHEFLGLAGPLACVAALCGLRLRDPRRWFWFAVLVLGLVLATGSRNEVGRILNELPPFRWGRAPGRALVLVVLAGSVLAADCVADLRGVLPAIPRALAPAALLASALVFGVPSPDVVRSDFYDFDWRPRLPVNALDHRVHVASNRYPYLERWGVRTLRDLCPLDTPGYRTLQSEPGRSWWFDLVAEIDVKWTGPPADSAATDAVTLRPTFRELDEGRDAVFFPGAASRERPDEAVARLRAGEIMFWMDDADGDVEATAPATSADRVVKRLATWSPTAMEFRVDPADGGWLLLPEKWYPGWQVEGADGAWRQAPRANFAFLAVPARAQVRIEYRPWWLALATIVSGASLLATALVVARRRVRQ